MTAPSTCKCIHGTLSLLTRTRKEVRGDVPWELLCTPAGTHRDNGSERPAWPSQDSCGGQGLLGSGALGGRHTEVAVRSSLRQVWPLHLLHSPTKKDFGNSCAPTTGAQSRELL